MDLAASIILLNKIVSFLKTLGILDWVISFSALGMAAKLIGMFTKLIHMNGGSKYANSHRRYYTHEQHK